MKDVEVGGGDARHMDAAGGKREEQERADAQLGR